MTQGSLFPELQLTPEPEADAQPALALPIPEEQSEPSSGQLLLFAPLTLHRTALEHAVAEGDFAEAARLRDVLSSEYGPAAVPDGLRYLDMLAECFQNLPDLSRLLSAWHHALDTITNPERQKQVTRGLFARLVRDMEPTEIARQDDSCIPELANFLYESGRAGDARCLIRDALLRNLDLPPDALKEPRARDLLAETLAPRWLACLGALCGVWAAPPPEEPELAAISAALAQPLPSSDSDRALSFWECLRLAALKHRLPESMLHATRRRMKALHPEFHQLHMNRGL